MEMFFGLDGPSPKNLFPCMTKWRAEHMCLVDVISVAFVLQFSLIALLLWNSRFAFVFEAFWTLKRECSELHDRWKVQKRPKKRWRLNVEMLKQPIKSSSEKFRRVHYFQPISIVLLCHFSTYQKTIYNLGGALTKSGVTSIPFCFKLLRSILSTCKTWIK